MSNVSSLDSVLPPALQERLDRHLAGAAILDPSHPGHAAAREDAENITNLNRLLLSDAFRNPAHADHNLVKTRVNRFFEAEFGDVNPTRRVAAIVIDSGELHPPSNSPRWG